MKWSTTTYGSSVIVCQADLVTRKTESLSWFSWNLIPRSPILIRSRLVALTFIKTSVISLTLASPHPSQTLIELATTTQSRRRLPESGRSDLIFYGLPKAASIWHFNLVRPSWPSWLLSSTSIEKVFEQNYDVVFQQLFFCFT